MHIRQIDSHEIQLSGALTFDNVPTIRQQLAKILPKLTTITINLAGVDYCDSSGLALLLECLRLSRTAQKTIRFSHLPSQMRAIAKVTHLESLIGTST